MAYAIRLEGKNLLEAEYLLHQGCRLAEACAMRYWLEGGTLLGIRRENRLLPWDNDLDISILADELPKLDLFLKKLKAAGFGVRIRRFETDSRPFRKGDIRMVKIRKRRFFGFIKGAVTLDVFVKYPEEGMAYWMIAGKTKAVPLPFYETFRNIEFKGQSYTIPEQTEAYLSYRYGAWEVPVEDWDTSRDDKALA